MPVKLLTSGGGGVNLVPTSSIASDVTMYLPVSGVSGGTVVCSDSSGNVGIGVTPSAWSTWSSVIQGNGYSIAGYNNGAGNVQLRFGSNVYNGSGGSTYYSSGYATDYRCAAGQHQWYTAPSGTAGDAITFTQVMTIDSYSQLLVGSTTSANFANYKTTSFGSGSAGAILQLQGSTGQDGAHIRLNASSGVPSELTIETRIGINLVMKSSQSGGVYLSPGATSWASASDERLKDIIEPIENAVGKVSTIRAVIGKYKTDEEGTRRSFLIAQDVQAVLSEAVNIQNDEQGTLGLQYTDVIPLLVAAIKEQSATIESLTERIAALEGDK